MPDIDFRDGKRGVPDHVAELLAGVPTYKLTYQEALEYMNRRLQYNYVENAHSKIVQQHFKDGR